jgi:hypothetical protein
MSQANPDPPPWTKVSLPLPPKHHWKATPGYQIFVANAGAVRLEFPQGWVVKNDGKQTIYFHDRTPPDDVARLSLTVFRLPKMPANWWTDLPMEKLMRQAMTGSSKKDAAEDDEGPIDFSSLVVERRGGVETGWMEKRLWKDPENGKSIRCRQAIARGRRTQVLLTYDVYQDAAETLHAYWDHLLKSLRLEAPVNTDGSGRN